MIYTMYFSTHTIIKIVVAVEWWYVLNKGMRLSLPTFTLPQKLNGEEQQLKK